MHLIHKYRGVLEQGFMPICVGDGFDIELLAEASLEAGARAIEITCRRRNALREVERVKKRFSQLLVLAGSVVDDGVLLRHLQRQRPDMPSIQHLMDAGVDGIVSALPLTRETIARVSASHLVIPGVETPTEAVAALETGAQFAKLFTADLMGGADRARRLTCAATHGLLPLFVTGGITQQRIAEYLSAGVAMLGSGWDVLLGEEYRELQQRPDRAKLVAALKGFLNTFQSSRIACQPAWSAIPQMDDRTFLNSLSHYVPVQFTEAR